MELRNQQSGVPTWCIPGEGHTLGDDRRELSSDATESETPRTSGNFMRENRETPSTPSPNGGGGRPVKAIGQTTGVHVGGESDNLVVPTKQANKAGRPAAEPVEGRGLTKGNTRQPTMCRAQDRESVWDRLEGVRQLARRDKEVRFTTLLHHVNIDLLRASYLALNRQASPGVDRVTWVEYGRDLEARLCDLHERIHRGSYRAKPSKRTWIPKADGKQRPLGVANLEDKIVQQALRTVLEQIYEEDFLDLSYGFRPGRGAHNALDALSVGLTRRKVNWVLDADIQGFFDTIDHERLLQMVELRIADPRVLRLLRKWLRAGVSEEGEWSRTTVGTPQGAVISPLLANVYLHYVLDRWAHHWRNTSAEGDVIIVRYADDFVMGFEHRHEAEAFLRLLEERMKRFGLRLHPTKTRLIEFGRYAVERRQRRGVGKPETFDFLGFTHYCSKTRKGWFTIKRRTMRKRLRAKLGAVQKELRRRMHDRLHETGTWLRAVVQGWFNYHAVPGNTPSLDQFRKQIARGWLDALRRRSQKGRSRWNWARMTKLVDRWLPRVRVLQPYPNQRLTWHPR